MANLNIVSGVSENEFCPGYNMTRAEFAVIVAKNILKLPGTEGTISSSRFSDVPTDHWAAAAINAMADNGYISGYDDDKFRPEGNITYNEIVKIIVDILGYSMYAQQTNVYPDSWISQAAKLGITDGTVSTGNQPIKRETVAKLIENALDVDLLQYTIESITPTYKVIDGENLMNQYLDIDIVKGVVTANHYTDIAGASSLAKGVVEIGKNMYMAGSSGAESLLGMYGKFYVTIPDESDITPEILFVTDTEKNEIVTVDASDINTDKCTINSFSYEEDYGDRVKEKTIKLNGKTSIIYNGKYRLSWPASIFDIDNGTVRLIKPYNASDYSVVFVYDYKTLVVDGKSTIENKLYFKNAPAGWNSLDLQNSSDIVITGPYGESVSYDSINEWDIAAVAKSEDGNIINIKISQKRVEGKVESKGEDSIVIDGIEYELASNMMGTEATYVIPTIGSSAVFLLDYNGRIAAVNYNDGTRSEYAYLIKIYEGETYDDACQLKMFDETGRMLKLTAANYVQINGVRTKGTDIMDSTKLYNGVSTKRQLITYETNDSGNLTKINTAIDLVKGEEKKSEQDFVKSAELTSSMFRGGIQCSFASKYFVRPGVKTFLVPSDSQDIDDESLYQIKDYGYIISGGERSYSNLTLYDVDENNIIGAIVQTSPLYITYGSNVMVIDKIFSGVNSEGEEAPMLQGYSASENVQLIASNSDLEATFKSSVLTDAEIDKVSEGGVLPETISLYDLNRGDVIQYQSDRNGELAFVKVLFRAQSPEENEYYGTGSRPTEAEANSTLYYGYGTVDKRMDTAVKYTVNKEPNPYQRAVAWDGASFYMFDKGRNSLMKIESNEIQAGDKMFIRMNGNTAKEIIIYR